MPKNMIVSTFNNKLMNEKGNRNTLILLFITVFETIIKPMISDGYFLELGSNKKEKKIQDKTWVWPKAIWEKQPCEEKI